MINKDIKVPNNLKRVNGSFLSIIKVIPLMINISKKEVKWRVQVVDKMIALLIIGNNFHDKKSIINYFKLIKGYKKVNTLITIKRK